MVSNHRVRGSEPIQTDHSRSLAAVQPRYWSDRFHAQRGISEQLDVNRAIHGIRGITIKAVVVHRKANAVAQRFTQTYVVEVVLWPTRNTVNGQPHGGRAENGAHDIVGFIPVTEMAAFEQEEHRLGILRIQIGIPHVVVLAMNPELADAIEL